MDLCAAHHALFDRLPDVTYFCKDTQGRYTHANQTLLRRLGLNEVGELQGKTAAQVFPAPLGQHYWQQDLQVIRSGASLHDLLERHLFAGGQSGWCLTVKHPVRQDGAVRGVVGISRDLKGPSTHDPVYQRLSASLAWAREHCTDPVGVADLARHAGLSVAQLERHVLALLQLTPSRWLLSLRLESAVARLDSPATIAQVAADSGFADHSAFARAFRRHLGVSPRDYRQMRLTMA
ncbi:MAG: helix-turn-helix domain-containing protein [Rhodoferax sp.]|nr:helix-turn-helix domain-containing protein [Rhodoferax sp.]MBK9237733.1 helix-turn-helix domain-containing protein [Rhodoferax sp.]